MKLKEIYELIKEKEWDWFINDMLDLYFPNEHGAYYMYSEGGEECCLDELWKEVGGDYEMPKEFDQLIECYKKHYDKEEYDKIEEFVNTIKI